MKPETIYLLKASFLKIADLEKTAPIETERPKSSTIQGFSVVSNLPSRSLEEKQMAYLNADSFFDNNQTLKSSLTK
jgi:hypothetical protein